MSQNFGSSQSPSSFWTRKARLTFVGVVLTWSCVSTFAQPPQMASRSPSAQSYGAVANDLEGAFWRCDHATTTALLDTAAATECSDVYEALLKGRFQNDFTALLVWWRQEKAAAHATISAAARSPGSAGALGALEVRPTMHSVAASAEAGVSTSTDPLRRQFEILAESEIKNVYQQCSRAALDSRLDRGEIAVCSVAYDVLLKRHFGGDFDALLRWSRRQVDDGRDAAVDDTASRANRSTATRDRALRQTRWN